MDGLEWKLGRSQTVLQTSAGKRNMSQKRSSRGKGYALRTFTAILGTRTPEGVDPFVFWNAQFFGVGGRG